MSSCHKDVVNGSHVKKEELPLSVYGSNAAHNTTNALRWIVDRMTLSSNSSKKMIHLSSGDPTRYGNLLPPPDAINAIAETLKHPSTHSYTPTFGTVAARTAVAEYLTKDGSPCKMEDVILASGCTHALEMAINCLLDTGDNILLPRPGYSQYDTICNSFGINKHYYNLIPDKQWEVDLKHFESVIDKRTRAVMINNPSNPCASVYTRQHLKDIISLCEKYRLPIIADEIYAQMVFPGNDFHYMSALSENVPIIHCGGISKLYCCPGWRLGWIVIHDRHNAFQKYIRPGLLSISSRIMGPSSIPQAALPSILSLKHKAYLDDMIDLVKQNADLVYDMLGSIPGLTPVMPQGAVYMMIQLDFDAFNDIGNETDFFQKLLDEQSVTCLPGTVFNAPNYIRIVTTVPTEMLEDACHRVIEFCNKHKKI